MSIAGRSATAGGQFLHRSWFVPIVDRLLYAFLKVGGGRWTLLLADLSQIETFLSANSRLLPFMGALIFVAQLRLPRCWLTACTSNYCLHAVLWWWWWYLSTCHYREWWSFLGICSKYIHSLPTGWTTLTLVHYYYYYGENSVIEIHWRSASTSLLRHIYFTTAPSQRQCHHIVGLSLKTVRDKA